MPDLAATGDPHHPMTMDSLAIDAANVRAVPLWITGGTVPLLSWIHRPVGPVAGVVLLCPPIGYDLWVTYQTYRQWAEALQAAGYLTLRFDYAGTGDSGGRTAADAVQAWQGSIDTVIAWARSAAPEVPLIVGGLRLGATLALLKAQEHGIESVMLIDPVVSGRRHVRELKVLASVPSEPVADDDTEIAGCVFNAATLTSIGQLELTRSACDRVRRILLIERDDRPANETLAQHLRNANVALTQATMGMASLLDVSTEDAQVPAALLDHSVRWLQQEHAGRAHSLQAAAVEEMRTTDMEWEQGRITEECVRIGALGLFGIHGRPHAAPASHLVIFLSSGIEHRIGPGRSWVEFARAMNEAGLATLRIDFDGVGDSPLRGSRRRVRPYDPEFLQDVAEFIRFGRERGYQRITVLGLCSGAWIAVQAGLTLGANSVVAINPQLYWQMGDPVESLLQDTRIRRTAECRREVSGERWGVWTVLDVLGLKTAAGRWLDALVARRIPTLLAFAANDDGVNHLRIRCARRLRKVLENDVISLVEVADIDHPMHRHRRRPAMYAHIIDFLKKI